MFLTTFLERTIEKVETIGAAALPSVTYRVQLVVLGSEQHLYQPSAVREKLNTNSSDKIFRAAVAAMTRLDQHRQQSLLQRKLKSPVRASKVL